MSTLALAVPVMETRDFFVPTNRSTISALSISPDGRYCGIGDVKGVVEIIETVSVGNVPRQLDFGSRVRQLAWHDLAGSWFLICALSDSTVRIWAEDYGVSEEREIFQFSAPVHSFAISPSGGQMVVSCGYSIVLFDDPLVSYTGRERAPTERWDCPEDIIGGKDEDFLANPVATHVAFLGDDVLMMCFLTGIDHKPYKKLFSLSPSFPSLIGGVAVSPGLQTIMVTNLNNGVDFASLQTKGWIGHYQFAESLPLLPYEASYLDDKYVVVGHGNNLVHIFDTNGDFKEPVRTIEFPDLQYEHMSDIDCVASGALKGALPSYYHGEPVIVVAYGKESFSKVFVIRPKQGSGHVAYQGAIKGAEGVRSNGQEGSNNFDEQEGTPTAQTELTGTTTDDEQLSDMSASQGEEKAGTSDVKQVDEEPADAPEASADRPGEDKAKGRTHTIRKALLYEQIVGAGILLVIGYSMVIFYFHLKADSAFNHADHLQELAAAIHRLFRN
ncbi:hypothetical protein D9619_011461 [Psilocybe cf. subviscida]|uniref:Uncharacterized protein n=1 Tax=Psilocybe cf. subviscida TaxID=2480587 RepID=A0A8H5BSY1_9AGAR|nr:hypothetical protein D9619_011461 [Psilocybe cf. subviscida]